jgi:hypothetical protein
MKKILLPIFIVFTALLMVSCEQNDARKIIGHTYECNTSAGWETMYFSPSGSVQLKGTMTGERYETSNLTYDIFENTVEIRYDYSSFWKDEYKGTLLGTMIYHPEEDRLYYGSLVYHRSH